MKYRAKHVKTMKLHHFKKSAVLLIALALIVTVGVGSTLAYLIDTSTEVTNTFQPSEVTCRVDETFKDNVKSAVRIQNTSDTGDVDAYIRAAVVVTWKDADGNVYGQKPEVGNETIGLKVSKIQGKDVWIEGADGFYYWTSPVPVNEFTGNLIDTFTYNDTITVGSDTNKVTYYLSVEIIAEAIQAEPTDAVKEAWGVTVADNGTISKQ